MRHRTRGVWISWLGALWLLAIFIGSIVDYSRGVDVVAVLIAFIGQLVVTIAWTLWRPLPLWIVAFWGLIMLSALVGLLITVPGSAFLSWSVLALVPTGLAMLIAAGAQVDRSPSLVH